ncbi:hypothetical protein [Amycolatopsis sp. cg9]|uniref:hypothetical protein n=1 Tax=Amycolatopsis sp. cg9 TaxID=3238801 RepID=UPI003525099E
MPGGIHDAIQNFGRSQLPVCHRLRIPDGHVLGAGPENGDGGPAVKDRHRVRVTVNDMRLASDQVLGKTYDPIVLAVTEFVFDGAACRVPFVVGSSMVNAEHGTPRTMRYTDTLVAGPFPYTGRIAVTVILYRLLRDDYVRAALDAVQKICSAVGVGGPMSTGLGIANGVLDAVEAALGHKQVQPVLGERIELHGDQLPSASFAVLPDSELADRLWLDGGMLKKGDTAASAKPPAKTDYIVFSVDAEPLVDLKSLPWFTPLWNRIVRWAGIPNEDARSVTRNYLAALYEEIATSPDVPPDAVDDVYARWAQRATTIRERAQGIERWDSTRREADPLLARALHIRSAS